MEKLKFTVFIGYGPASSTIRRNTVKIVDALRELGFGVVYEEVTVPALDFVDYEPFVKVNEEEVYIPSVNIDEERLLDYFINVELPRILGVTASMPLPPMESVVTV